MTSDFCFFKFLQRSVEGVLTIPWKKQITYLPIQGTSPSSRTFPSFLARWATHFQLCLAWS